MNIQRLRKADDLSDLFELSTQFFEEYQVHHPEFFKLDELQEKDFADYFARFLDQEDAAAFIAIEAGHIVGYITAYIQSQPDFWQIKQVGCISGLMVHKNHRRGGIGNQLLNEASRFFEEQGIKYFTVYTAANNQPAIEFYTRNGMTPLYTTMINMIGDRQTDNETKSKGRG